MQAHRTARIRSHSVGATSCAALDGMTIPAREIGLPTAGAAITSATLEAASGSLPEYCVVLGTIQSVDTTAPSIDFGVDLPTDWNGSAFQLGGGGMDGTIPDLTGGNPEASVPSPLARDYATYGSDSGHQIGSNPLAPDLTWILHQESWMNFAYEQIKKTHDAAMAVMDAYYGETPKLNYWMGSSQGGREGLEAITRWPEDYNGAAVEAPLAYFSSLFPNPDYLGTKQLNPAAWVSPSQVPLVANDVIHRCDGLDGNQDGVINNYLACDELVDPTTSPAPFASLECPDPDTYTSSSCLSADQLNTLAAMYEPIVYPYTLAGGENYWPGWGTGLEGSSFLGLSWLWSPIQPEVTDANYGFGPGATSVRTYMCGCIGGSFSMLSYNIFTYQQKMQTLSRQVDIAPSISRWIARGGKLIMVTDGSDAISNPRAQMMLYNAWVANDGRNNVDNAVRYYVDPNVGHVGGLPPAFDSAGNLLPGSVDVEDMMINWVQDKQAPPSDPTAVTENPQGQVTYSKPACEFPSYPQYGSGAVTLASSYSCRSPYANLWDEIASSALSRQVAQPLAIRLKQVVRDLNSTGAACRDLNDLTESVLRDALDRKIDASTAEQIVNDISVEEMGVGCITYKPTQANVERILQLIAQGGKR